MTSLHSITSTKHSDDHVMHASAAKSQYRCPVQPVHGLRLGKDCSRVIIADHSRLTRTWEACYCFQCSPVHCEDLKWAVLFQRSELNIAIRILWYLPHHMRCMVSCTATGTFASYKMGLPRLTYTCTVVTRDGLQLQGNYDAAWYKRDKGLLNMSVQSNDYATLFPRTILCGIAQFLDFDEISILSLGHVFIREFTKSEMKHLRCLKIHDFCDMSDVFCVMRDAMRVYNNRIFPIVAGNTIKLFGACRYSDETLCFLAGMDRIYKLNMEKQLDTFRQSREDRYQHVLDDLFIQYLGQNLFRAR